MSTTRGPRQPRPGKLGEGFLAGIDAPKPKPKRERASAADSALDQGNTSTQGSAADIAPPPSAPAEGKGTAPARSTPQETSTEAPVEAQPSAPTTPEPAAPAPKRTGTKIRRTAFLPPELIARVKLATATNGGTYTFITLQAMGELYEQGRLTQVVTDYAARSEASSTAGSSLFPDLTTRAPARPKAQFPLHLTEGQLQTVDALKDQLGVDRSLLIEAVLDATLPQ